MKSVNYAAAFIIAALTVVLLVAGRPLLIPFAIAVMIWFLINALATGFANLRLGSAAPPPWLCMTASILSVLAALYFVGNLVGNNVAAVSEAAPLYQENLQRLVERAYAGFGMEGAPTITGLVADIEIGPLITNMASTLAALIGNAGIVLIYLLFLLLEQNSFDRKITHLAGNPEREQRLRTIIHEINEDITTYVWIKTLASLLTGGVSYFVLLLVGVDYPAFWGFIIFLLNFIPTIGSLLGIMLPSLLALVQFDTFTPFFIVFPVLGAVQFAFGTLLEPRLMGRSLNLSALVVILSLTVWGSIWGIAGMFLSVPIMVMLMIIFSNFEQTRPIAILLSGDGQIKTPLAR